MFWEDFMRNKYQVTMDPQFESHFEYKMKFPSEYKMITFGHISMVVIR